MTKQRIKRYLILSIPYTYSDWFPPIWERHGEWQKSLFLPHPYWG